MDARDHVTDSSDFIEESVLLGGISKRFTSKSFKGGKITAVMGGAEIYLGDCEIQDDVTIQVNTVMGGTELTIPRTWNLRVTANALLGGIDDGRKNIPPHDSSAPTLILSGSVMMGGVEVKSI
jgi:hypothetical protein